MKYIRVDDNKSINKSIDELCKFFLECTNLEYINISDNSMKKRYMQSVADSIIKSCGNGSNLETLIWNYDPSSSPTIAKNFIEAIEKLDKTNLKEIKMCGVFTVMKTRRSLTKQLKAKGINLVLFEPSYTDESS